MLESRRSRGGDSVPPARHGPSDSPAAGSSLFEGFTSAKAIAVLLVISMTLWLTPATWSDEIKQLKVVVNQLDDTKTPSAADRQKAMNDILKQCEAYGVRIRVTITKINKKQDPKDPNGTSIAPGGTVADANSAAKLEKNAKDGEIKNGGFKMWIAKGGSLGGDNGGTWINSPSSVVSEQSDPNSVHGDGRTWTHEMAHGLGLGHNADANGDTSKGDPNNLLFYARTRGGNPTGDDLTKEQCEELLKAIKKLNPTTSKTKEQQLEAKGVSKSSSAVDPLEDPPPVGASSVDISYATVNVDENMFTLGQSYLTVDLFLLGPILTFPGPDYRVWLDVDNDPATGDPPGYDAVLQLSVLGPGLGELALFALPGFLPMGVFDLEVAESSFDVTGPIDGYSTGEATTLSGQVPLSTLESIVPIASEIVFEVTAEDGPLFDSVGPDFVETFFNDLPELTLDVVEAVPSQTVTATGGNFDLASSYVLLFEDEEVKSGTTGPAGELGPMSFEVPDVPPGDYLVDAISADGAAAIYVLRVNPPNIPTLTPYGLLLLLLGLALAGAWTLRRMRRRTRSTLT